MRVLTETRNQTSCSHWLPVKSRIDFKSLSFHMQNAKYAALVVPGVSKSKMGGSAFSSKGPLLWNQLQAWIWDRDSLSIRSDLKLSFFKSS